MPKVVREDIDNLNAIVTVTLEKGEYRPKFDAELARYRQQAHMKGFRKGKTPLSVLKKMYGKAVLADVVNEMLQKALFDYLQEQELDILGQPLPSKDQESIDLDAKTLENEYVFKFDVGLVPRFDVQGIDASNTFRRYAVEIPDSLIDEELDRARKQLGERVVSEQEILPDDLLKVIVQEMADGAVVEDGIHHTFSILVSKLSDPVRQQIIDAGVGSVHQINLLDLEVDTDEKYARRYFMNLEDDDDREVNPIFQLTVEEASRVTPAELDEDFFGQYFNDESVTTEAEAREKIREDIAGYYRQQADSLLYRDFQEKLLEMNPLELPDDFLKRWLQQTNENTSLETIEKEYDSFAKNLQWTIIRNRLIKDFNLEVTENDVMDAMRVRVQGYFGNNPAFGQEMVDMMVNRMLQDEKQFEQIYSELMTDRLFDAVAEKVAIEEDPISMDAFAEIAEEARRVAEAARKAGADEEE